MADFYLNLPDKVVFPNTDEDFDSENDFAMVAIYGERWTYSDAEKLQIATFENEFELLGAHLANTDFYQGLNKMSVIRRKTDHKLFGFEWFDDISKHGESYYEPNGDEHGYDYGDYVFLPVEQYPAPLKFYRLT